MTLKELNKKLEDLEMTDEQLRLKIKSRSKAKKSTSGFSIGQSWISGRSYIPTPWIYLLTEGDEDYVFSSIKKLIRSSFETDGDGYWDKIFKEWKRTDNYKKLKILFEPVEEEAKKEREGKVNELDRFSRSIVSDNINLLPEQMVETLKDLYYYEETK